MPWGHYRQMWLRPSNHTKAVRVNLMTAAKLHFSPAKLPLAPTVRKNTLTSVQLIYWCAANATRRAMLGRVGLAQIHFNHVLVAGPTTHAMSAWTHPSDGQGAGYSSWEYWQHLARVAERGCFDGVFFADVLSVGGHNYEFESVRFGGVPRYDPFSVVAGMAAATTHLGFAATLTTSGTPPFIAARRVSTLDNLTGGRMAWNVVTGYLEADFKALGMDRPEHDDRYDQADEYIEICKRLWDGFPASAIVRDAAQGIYLDMDQIKKVQFEGKYYKCETYPVIEQSPQGRPLIFQAGASPRGLRYAVRHADAIFALQPRVAMADCVSTVKSAASAEKQRSPKVFLGIQPIIADTEELALSYVRELEATVPIEPAVSRLAGLLGVDFKLEDLDKPVDRLGTEGSQGWVASVMNWSGDGSPTLREMVQHFGTSPMTPRLVGPPERVAAEIEAIWRETGCYGFTISPHTNPSSIETFVDEVVPILQAKGLMRTEYAGYTYRENLEQN